MNPELIATSGCFDLFHAGHVAFLKEMSKRRHTVVVFLNTDESIKRIKNPMGPVQPYHAREAVLKACRYVTHVYPLADDTPNRVLSQFKPAIYAKGSEYEGKNIPEQEVVEAYGGSLLFLDSDVPIHGQDLISIIENRVRLNPMTKEGLDAIAFTHYGQTRS